MVFFAAIMAKTDSSGNLLFNELSSQFLVCTLCLEQYVDPKVLPCQHTFCLECLKKYVAAREFSHTFPCPLCQEKIIIPDNDVNKLKNNFFVVSLLHFVKDSQKANVQTGNNVEAFSLSAKSVSSENRLCGACGETDSLATFCKSCTLWLCLTCTKAHGRLPATSNHELLTNEQVDHHCKSMVEMGNNLIGDMVQTNTSRHEFLSSQVMQLQENFSCIKKRIEQTAEETHKIIQDKEAALLQQSDCFHQDQTKLIHQKLLEVEERKRDLSNIQQVLDSITYSNDGFRNQISLQVVERFLAKTAGKDFSHQTDKLANLAFTIFNSNFTEMKNLDMGQLRVVSVNAKSQHNRPLVLQKVASLIERDYISALSVNKFAQKLVVSNNQTILIFKPDSRVPQPFLTASSGRTVKKPWGIAFCQDKKCVYVSEAGRHEGDGAVLAYSVNGTFESTISSFLTLPRGLAVNKGCIYVCDQIDKCVYIFNLNGKIMRLLKKTPDGKCLFTSPMFVSVGKSGVIAVSDNCTSVKVFDKDCILRFTYTSTLPESQFWDVHVMPDGAVIVCDWKHGLHKISPDFQENGLLATENNILREPSALAALENGSTVYIGTCGGEIFSAI